jgi:hypothetical protein
VRVVAIFAIALLMPGCTPTAQSAYQANLDCFAFFYGVPTNSADRVDVAARAAFRDRAIAKGRAIGLGAEQVEAQARAGHAAFQAQLSGMGAHSGEEHLEETRSICVARLTTAS